MQRWIAAVAALTLAACATQISLHEEEEHLVYDTPGVVVWVWPCCGPGEERCEYAHHAATGLGELLKSGRLSGEQLFRALPGAEEVEVRSGSRFLPRLHPLDALSMYDGPMVKVFRVVEDPGRNGHTLVLRLAVTRSIHETGWGSMDLLDVVVANPRVLAAADRKRFFQGAKVVSIRHTGMEV